MRSQTIKNTLDQELLEQYIQEQFEERRMNKKPSVAEIRRRVEIKKVGLKN